jgi:hypothetical protein
MNVPNEPRGKRVRSIGELPEAIEPRRDLWPAIEAAIGAPAARVDAAPRRRTGRVPQFLALAATIAALAVGVWIGRSTLPVGPDAPSDGVTAGNGVASTVLPVGYVNDPVYRQERARLVRALEGQLASLSPETRQKVAASLETIRQSMKDLEAALGRDPSNALLQGLLVNTYQEEMRVLTEVKQASTVSEEI